LLKHTHLSGSFSCKAPCGKGFSRNLDGACDDVDECLSNPCGVNQVCNNADGGFSCDCAEGLKMLGDACVPETCDNFPGLCAAGDECVAVGGNTLFKKSQTFAFLCKS